MTCSTCGQEPAFPGWVGPLVADGADDRPFHPAHDVRAVAELFDFPEDVRLSSFFDNPGLRTIIIIVAGLMLALFPQCAMRIAPRQDGDASILVGRAGSGLPALSSARHSCNGDSA